MYVLIAWLLMTALWQAQQPNTGRLVLVVRDEAATPVAGVHIGLYRDADGGRQEIGEYVTDSAGQVVLEDAVWGLYIVQFRGSLPDGQPIQPADRQNLGLLDDGNGVANGFGVRFASAERTELFVLAHSVDEGLAVPLFDMAPDTSVSPQPISPLGDAGVPDLLGNDPQSINPAIVQLALPSATALALAPPTAVATSAASAHQPRPYIVLFCLVSAFLIGGFVAAGWYQAMRAERQHAR